jgi:MFS family permease
MTRDVRIVCFSLFLWGLGEGLFIYFQPIYLNQLGADPIEIGGMLGMASLAFAISHIPAGALADTIGRKHVIVLAWYGGTLAGLIMFLATSLPVFVIGLAMYSFTGFVTAPLNSYVTAAKGSWTVTRALTTSFASLSIGSIIGPVLGGQLAELLGLKIIFALATGVFALSTILILFIRPQPVEVASDGSRYQYLFRNKALAGFLLLVFIVLLGMYISWPLTPIYLQEVRSVSVGSLGLFGSINASGMVMLSLMLGRLNPRIGFLIAQLAVGFSVVLLWKGTGQVWLSIGYFLAAGFRTSRSLIAAHVENLVNRVELGLAYGLGETINGIVMFIAAPIAGVLYDRSQELPFIVSIGILLLAIIITIRNPTGKHISKPVIEASINQS